MFLFLRVVGNVIANSNYSVSTPTVIIAMLAHEPRIGINLVVAIRPGTAATSYQFVTASYTTIRATDLPFSSCSGV
jgi:hypothetical protein